MITMLLEADLVIACEFTRIRILSFDDLRSPTWALKPWKSDLGIRAAES